MPDDGVHAPPFSMRSTPLEAARRAAFEPGITLLEALSGKPVGRD
jgi:hypothetical protein